MDKSLRDKKILKPFESIDNVLTVIFNGTYNLIDVVERENLLLVYYEISDYFKVSLKL